MTFEKLKELIDEIKAELLIIDGEDRKYISAWEDGYYDGSSAAYRNILVDLEEIVKDEIEDE